MSGFLQFALEKETKENLSNDDVVRWAGRLDNWDFYNSAALEVARKYHQGQLTYSFCDWLMNQLWRSVVEGLTSDNGRVPEPFYEIFQAFDAGEYYRTKDKSDDPISDFTDPMIAELVSRIGPGQV
jgi:hypothetical protein